ncbi:MAG: phenylalanine--tRNA ligase subunit beta [Muribaculaceae bacterium]|nr:phenylalanine--tRNA ligase subunit beta [Muribaculaceae bacterium]
MNVSYKWLKSYLDFNLTPQELADTLTSVGLETGSVERVESIRGGLRGLVIGKVLTCVEHPDSDHLHVTTVDLGDGEPVQIVCGAPNVAAGQTVVVATIGTTLYDGDKEFKIKRGKIRGVESLGMICAEDEIGVGTSHDGIIVLPDGAAAPGTPAAEYYKLSDDFVLEVDLTPNRIDAASHYGVARDLAAYLDCHLTTEPPVLHKPSVDEFHVDAPEASSVKVEVEAEDVVTRYCGVTIEGVNVTESPEWLRTLLTTVGIRPINNVVDITNYILHAVGQPLHAFDRNRIAGDKVVVRKATPSKFVTLDGVERTLDPADLMICNAEQPMCIAGVFGGLDSGVTESTTSVFIESACFNATSVRRTARRHGLSTDASFRYERGVDPNGCLYAMKLAALMIQQIAGGRVSGEVVDYYPQPVAPYPVNLSYGQITRLLGQEIPSASVDTILKSLEIDVISRTEADGGTMQLAVPTYRVDVRRPCDVIEDILRIYGYNNIDIPTSVHASLSYKSDTDAADDLRHIVADNLSGAGWMEILNNSLTAKAYYDGLATFPAEKAITLLNPLSQDLNVLRQSLLFGGLESLAHNINRRSPDLAFYEFGNVYSLRSTDAPTAEAPLKPYTEGARLALWLTGDLRQPSWLRPAEESSFFDLKATVAMILSRIGLNPAEVTVKATDIPDIYSSAIAIETRNGKLLGTAGVLSPDILRRVDIKVPVYFAELDWNALAAMTARRGTTFTPLPKAMSVKRDLSLLLDKDVTMAQIDDVVRRSDRKLLRSVALFDVYEGKGLPEDKKSYAITITLRDDEKTLNDKAVDAVMSKVIANLRKQLGAELR